MIYIYWISFSWQDCSLFYTKRFCLPCVRDHLQQFPEEVQNEVLRKECPEDVLFMMLEWFSQDTSEPSGQTHNMNL